MKNIAEYFRDLAAGDRFFGAEPPQPDPEMLQSIAEQTIQARVNAQLSDTGLVLRQDAASGSTPTAPDAIAPAAAVVAAAAVAPQVTPQVAPATSAPAPGVETVAEKLQRIRAAVSRENAQDALYSEDQHVEEFTAETTAPLGDYEDLIDEAPVEDAVAEVVEEEVTSEATVAETDTDAVAEAADDMPSDDVAIDESPAEETVEDAPALEEATAEAAADEGVFEDDSSDDATEGDIDLASIVARSDLSTDEAEQADEADVAETAEAEVASDEEDADQADKAFHGETVAQAIADAEALVADEDPSDTVEDAAEDMDATAREEAAETAIDSVLGKVSDDEESEDATPRRRIVVQKITREDLKAARKEAQAAALLKDDESEAPDSATSDSDLPPEQEEELLRELAALQSDGEETAAEMTFENDPDATQDQGDEDVAAGLADLVAESEDDDIDDDLAEALSGIVAEDEDGYRKEEQDAAREVRRARREAITEDHEDDVERLISTTSSRIDNDESSQRRASIAHLKAAVAATKADASLTEAAQEQEARERDQYAEDLARVVRPERKVPSGERAKTDRPAPLVLVSELRIDKDEDDADDPTAAQTPDTPDAPVRPRRVSRADADDEVEADDQNIFTDADHASFAEYAASADALELPDLLEAAAAYYTYVESTEQFTRPMLMRKIASISERDGFSREAGLRSFGTLLREGKLVKGSDGKFVIAKTSRFTPEARYAGE